METIGQVEVITRVGGVGGRKWRQLYLKNNEKEKTYKNKTSRAYNF